MNLDANLDGACSMKSIAGKQHRVGGCLNNGKTEATVNGKTRELAFQPHGALDLRAVQIDDLKSTPAKVFPICFIEVIQFRCNERQSDYKAKGKQKGGRENTAFPQVDETGRVVDNNINRQWKALAPPIRPETPAGTAVQRRVAKK